MQEKLENVFDSKFNNFVKRRETSNSELVVGSGDNLKYVNKKLAISGFSILIRFYKIHIKSVSKTNWHTLLYICPLWIRIWVKCGRHISKRWNNVEPWNFIMQLIVEIQFHEGPVQLWQKYLPYFLKSCPGRLTKVVISKVQKFE